jgi:hypothetical protein
MKDKEKTTKELIADYINEIANLKRVENLAQRLTTLNDIKIVYEGKAKEYTSLYAKLDAQTKNFEKVLNSDETTKSDKKRIEALTKLGQIKIDLAKKNDAINELINSKSEIRVELPLENKTNEG